MPKWKFMALVRLSNSHLFTKRIGNHLGIDVAVEGQYNFHKQSHRVVWRVFDPKVVP